MILCFVMSFMKTILAKTFNRPKWKTLLVNLRKHKTNEIERSLPNGIDLVEMKRRLSNDQFVKKNLELNPKQ